MCYCFHGHFGWRYVYISTLADFLVDILSGLDEITKGFRFIVGNFHLGSIGVGLIFSTAVIFISQFTLYFTMSVKAPTGNRRSITVFFLHFIYLSALIIMLRGEILCMLHLNMLFDSLFRRYRCHASDICKTKEYSYLQSLTNRDCSIS